MLVGLVGPARIPCHGATLVVPIVQLNALFFEEWFSDLLIASGVCAVLLTAWCKASGGLLKRPRECNSNNSYAPTLF